MAFKTSDIQVAADLAVFSFRYSQSKQMVGDVLFPRFRVPRSTGIYYTFNSDHLRREDTIRADGAEARTMEISLGTQGTYSCLEYATKFAMANKHLENADPGVNFPQSITQGLTDKLDLDREYRAITLATSASVTQSATLAAAHQWSNYSSSDADPLEDIRTAKTTIWKATGQTATDFFCNYEVACVLAANPFIKALRQSWDSKYLLDMGLPPALAGLKVHISGGITNSAAQGQTASLGALLTDTCIIAAINPNPGLLSVT